MLPYAKGVSVEQAIEIAGDIVASGTALAGLLLVFMGAASASFQTYDAQSKPDVKDEALKPVLEVHELLKNKLSRDKLTQKYWVSDFTALIIDRVWQQISS